MQGLCFRSCRVRCRCSEVQAWASGRELGRSCPTLSLPLPSKPQHSSPGRRSLMESRGFQQLGSALRYTTTCHERYCTCGRPIGTSQGLWGAVSCFPGRRRGTALRGPGPRGLPSPPSDQREAGADPPCAAGGVVAHRRPPPPRRLLALRGKGKAGHCICHFSALLLPQSRSEVADEKGHRCPWPQTETAPRQSECWLWPTHCQDPVASAPCGGCGSLYLWR